MSKCRVFWVTNVATLGIQLQQWLCSLRSHSRFQSLAGWQTKKNTIFFLFPTYFFSLPSLVSSFVMEKSSRGFQVYYLPGKENHPLIFFPGKTLVYIFLFLSFPVAKSSMRLVLTFTAWTTQKLVAIPCKYETSMKRYTCFLRRVARLGVSFTQ